MVSSPIRRHEEMATSMPCSKPGDRGFATPVM
jgi:hypothetical protein